MDPETVAVDVIARVDGFDGKIRQSASAFGGQMKLIENSANAAERKVGGALANVERAMARTSQQSRLLGYQISDIGVQLSAGTSPFLVLAQQGPQVANALEGAKGAVGRFATFLSGPWGAAMLAATTMLGVFISKTGDTSDSVDDLVEKLKDQARQARDTERAQAEFGNTLEGVRKALDDNRDALDKLNRVQDTSAEAAYKAADAQRVKAIRIRETTVALLEQARAEYESSRSQNFGAAGGAGAGIAQGIYAGRVSEVEKLLAEAEAELERARKQTIEAQAKLSAERGSATKEDRVNREYDAMIDKATRAAIASGKVGESLEREVQAIERRREARLKEIRDTERNRPSSSASGSADARVGDMTALIKQLFPEARITSTTGGKHVKGSDHYAGRAIDFVIPGLMNEAGTKLVQEMLKAAGVEIRRSASGKEQFFGPGRPASKPGDHDDHFHVAWKGSASPESAARAREQATRIEQQRADRAARVAGEMASLDEQILRRREAAAKSAEEQANFERDRIDAAEREYQAELDHLVQMNERSDGLKGITKAEAEILKKKQAEIAQIDRELVDRREAARQRREALDIATGVLDNNLDLLRSEESLATTQKERRRLALAILDAEYEKLRIALEGAIKEGEANGVSEELLKVKRQQLANLQAQKANATKGALRDTAAPFESYIDSIRDTAEAMDEEFERVAVGGLTSIIDGLGQAAAGFTNLGDVARGVLAQITAQLVRLAAQQILLKALGEQIGKSAEASAGAGEAAASGAGPAMAATQAQAAAAAAAWAPAAAAASLATLGANQGPAITALLATHALSAALSAAGAALGRKDGGPIFGPGGPRDDRVPVMASNGEYMIKAQSAAKLGRGTLDRLNLTGELPSMADAPSIALGPINKPAAGSGPGANLSPEAVTALRGIVQEAIGAMPDVKLYPTLDVVQLADRLYNDPGAQRRFFNMVSDNAGKLNSTLAR